MSAAAELTEEERKLVVKLLLKLTKGTVLDEPAKPVVRDRPMAGPKDFELVRRIRRRKGIR